LRPIREIDAGSHECLQSGRGSGGLDDFVMVDAQHDGNHRAHIGLVVDNENAGH